MDGLHCELIRKDKMKKKNAFFVVLIVFIITIFSGKILTNWLGNRLGRSSSYTIDYIIFSVCAIFYYIHASSPSRKGMFLILSVLGIIFSSPILFFIEYIIRGTLMKVMSPVGVLFLSLIFIWINLMAAEKIIGRLDKNTKMDRVRQK